MPQVLIKRNSASGSVPSSLAHGELAANTADRRLWVGDAAGAPAEISPILRGAIVGLGLEWVSGSSIRVTSGLAHLESTSGVVPLGDPGYLLEVPAAITVAGLTGLTANTWYSVYLHADGGVPGIEVATTDPAPYLGTAKSRAENASRRYLGSVRTDGAGALRRFVHDPTAGNVLWRQAVDAGDFWTRALSGGTATAATTVALTAQVPPVATWALLALANTGTATAYLATATDPLTATTYGHAVGAGVRNALPLPVSGQALRYLVDPGGSLLVDVRGFSMPR
jgi:hypothetical protein